MRRLVLTAGALVAAGLVLSLGASPASAHPLGNLTVNTYAGVVVHPTSVSVDYVLDLAELPTVQARQRIDADHDGTVSTPELDAYQRSECTTLADGLDVDLGSMRLDLTASRTLARLLPGQGGLQTLRVECALSAASSTEAATRLSFTDHNFTGRIGWREITLNGDGTTLLDSDAPTSSASQRLLAYPRGTAPLRELSAGATVRSGGPRRTGSVAAATTTAGPQARGADRLTQWFQHTVGDRDLTVGLAALSFVLAILLGSLHALAPGHGKTMMAAYVVGRRGTPKQVAAIGLTVAATHTAGVLALGTVLWLSQAVAPDRLLPWLTVASGSMLALCGLGLLYRRVVLGRTGHSHLRLPGLPDHDHDHHHDHGAHRHQDHPHPHAHDHPHPHDHPHAHDHPHPHDHPHAHDHPHPHDEQPAGPDGQAPPPFRRAWLVLMGIAGGLVPTPSALVVLLGAAALHRVWFGVVLVALYGLGMAASLMGAGLLLVRARRWLERNWYDRPRTAALLRYLPAVTALLLVGGGLSVILRGAAQL